MTGDEKEHRVRLHFMILSQVGGTLLTTLKKPLAPLLGPDYEWRFDRMWDRVSAKRAELLKALAARRLKDLSTNFSDTGMPQTAEARGWFQAQKLDVDERFGRMLPWYRLPFSPEKCVANYDYWAKAEFLMLDEALWLSTGLEPLAELDDLVFGLGATRGPRDPVAEHVKSRHLLLARAFDPHGHEIKLKPKSILEWVLSSDFPVQSGFLQMLETASARQDRGGIGEVPSLPVGEVDIAKSDDRELASLAKLLTAIAITEYGYVPTAPRSPIPRELEDMAALLGIQITTATIRKYLQVGARYLPSDWKPLKD